MLVSVSFDLSERLLSICLSLKLPPLLLHSLSLLLFIYLFIIFPLCSCWTAL